MSSAPRQSKEVNAMDEPLLLQHRDDRGVVTLTLNRPKTFNALSEAMLAALGDAVDALTDDDVVAPLCSEQPARPSALATTSRKCGPSLLSSTTGACSHSAQP
jgi:hypothetical protein